MFFLGNFFQMEVFISCVHLFERMKIIKQQNNKSGINNNRNDKTKKGCQKLTHLTCGVLNCIKKNSNYLVF